MLTTGPANSSIVGIQGPLVFGGTLSSISPSTVTYDGRSSTGAVLIAVVRDGSPGNISGSWEIDLDSNTIFSLAVSTGLTTIGFDAEDLLQNTVVPSPREGYAISVNPSLARQVYIDTAPPVVTFDQGSSSTSVSTIVTTLSVISGVITDNFQLGSLTISIQDLTDPASSYWMESGGGGFKSSVPIDISIHIETGNGAISSTWRYTGIGDTFRTPGHAYSVLATAVDSVNNTSKTTLSLSLPSSAQDSSQAQASIVDLSGLLVFDQLAYPVQYGVQSGTSAVQTICAHANPTADPQLLPTGIDQIELADTTGAIPQNLISPIPLAFDCPAGEYEWRVQSDPGQCIDNVDQLIAYFSGSIIGATQANVLLPIGTLDEPTGEQAVKRNWSGNTFANGVPVQDPNCHVKSGDVTSPLSNCIAQNYSVVFSGPQGMNLYSQTFKETIKESQYPGFLNCTPDNKVTVINTPGAAQIATPNNTVFDTNGWGFHAAWSVDLAYSLIDSMTNKDITDLMVINKMPPQGKNCADFATQTWKVNACNIPRAGQGASILKIVNLKSIINANSPRNSAGAAIPLIYPTLTVTRSDFAGAP